MDRSRADSIRAGLIPAIGAAIRPEGPATDEHRQAAVEALVVVAAAVFAAQHGVPRGPGGDEAIADAMLGAMRGWLEAARGPERHDPTGPRRGPRR